LGARSTCPPHPLIPSPPHYQSYGGREEKQKERERERVMRIEEVAMAAGLDRANKRGGGGDPTLGNTGSEA
jgi:hypothetical protein